MRTLRTWGRHKERHVRANRRTHEREPHALSPLDPTTDVDTVPPIVQEQTSIGRSHGTSSSLPPTSLHNTYTRT